MKRLKVTLSSLGIADLLKEDTRFNLLLFSAAMQGVSILLEALELLRTPSEKARDRNRELLLDDVVKLLCTQNEPHINYRLTKELVSLAPITTRIQFTIRPEATEFSSGVRFASSLCLEALFFGRGKNALLGMIKMEYSHIGRIGIRKAYVSSALY